MKTLVKENIVLFDICSDINNFNELLLNHGVGASFMGANTARFVTHLGFCDDQLDTLLKILKHLS